MTNETRDAFGFTVERRVEVVQGMAASVAEAVIRLRLIGALPLTFDLTEGYSGKDMKYLVGRLLDGKHLQFSVDNYYPGFSKTLDLHEYRLIAEALPNAAEKLYSRMKEI